MANLLVTTGVEMRVVSLLSLILLAIQTVNSFQGWQFFCSLCISVNNYDPAYFGSGTRLTVLGKNIIKILHIIVCLLTISKLQSENYCRV